MTQPPTQHDFAEPPQQLGAVNFPQAPRIRVVLDNRNAPTVAALYARFPVPAARWLARKVALRYTPRLNSRSSPVNPPAIT